VSEGVVRGGWLRVVEALFEHGIEVGGVDDFAVLVVDRGVEGYRWRRELGGIFVVASDLSAPL
jgi:hypothetical protein